MITSCSIGAVTFNDNTGYVITSVKGLDVPTSRIASYNIAGENFGRFVSAYYGKRKFSLEGYIIGADISDYINKKDALSNEISLYNGEITISFTLANSRTVQITAITTSVDYGLDSVVTASPFRIEFEASNPYLLSTEVHSQNLTMAYGGGGSVPPETMPMGLSANTGGSIFATNAGNAIAYPLVQIGGEIDGPSIRNITTGKEIQFNIYLAEGEYITVDFKNKTIYDNQGQNRYSTKQGEWWTMQAGTNQISLRAVSYTSTPSLFTWQDTYLTL